MAATIVMHGSRTPFPADLAARVADEQAESLGLPSIGVAGDANVTAEIPLPPGQLWERVAGTPSNAHAPLTARQDEAIVRAYADRDIRERGARGHSPAVCTDCPSASGIIRAGERVK